MNSTLLELGKWVGEKIAPLAYSGSRLRGAPLFHPRGVVYHANLEPAGTDKRLLPAANAISGRGLIRFSNTLWRKKEILPDGMGMAIRIAESGNDEREKVQDLILATLPRPSLLPVAAFLCDPTDFSKNRYYSATPYHIHKVGRVYLRALVVGARPQRGKDRWEKLENWVSSGRADFVLQIKRAGLPWKTFCRIHLTERAAPRLQTIYFNPFNTAKGIKPEGFINGMRKAVYEASQRARRLRLVEKPAQRAKAA